MIAEEFIQQVLYLQKNVPRPATFNDNCTNSEYTNYVGNCKNCYLSFGDANEEDCYYTRWCFDNRNCVDIDNTEQSELSYECIDSTHCYNCNFCQDCEDLVDCDLCYNCIGCNRCFCCVNLRRKEYCFYNEQLTKDAFLQKVKNIKKENSILEQEHMKFLEYQKQFPRVYMHQRQTEHSTGDYLFRSKNCLSCFDTWDCEDCMYLLSTYDLKDCLDTNFIAGKGSELNYELLSGWFTSNTNFSYACWHSYNLEYCELCFHSHDLFGCIGLNHKEYCILNKQYTKEYYFNEVKNIKVSLRKNNVHGRFFLPSVYPLEDSLACSLVTLDGAL